MKHNDKNVFEFCTYETKMYLIGLLLGDGCLSQQKGKSERITLALKDYEIIEKLNKLICPTRKIYINKPKKESHSKSYAVINMNSDFISELKSYGMCKRKSCIVQFPKNIENDRNFIRGYFDANGCVYKNYVKNKEYNCISITTGSIDFADGLMSILFQNGFNPKLNVEKRHKAYYIKLYRQNEVIKFGKWIYDNCEFYIDRKKRIFDDIV